MFSNFQIWQKIITYLYSCDKIITIQIQISRENWNYFFSNNGHHMMIYRTTIVFRAKIKWYKPKKVKKLALNSLLPTVQILTNYVLVLILCLFYFIITVIDRTSEMYYIYLRNRVTIFLIPSALLWPYYCGLRHTV